MRLLCFVVSKQMNYYKTMVISVIPHLVFWFNFSQPFSTKSVAASENAAALKTARLFLSDLCRGLGQGKIFQGFKTRNNIITSQA